MKRKPNTISEWTAVSVVAAMSLLHIVMHILGGWDISFVTTVIGLCFLILFFLNIKAYTYFLFMWALVQLVEINFAFENSIFNLDQVFSAGFYMNFNTGKNNCQIGIGAAGIFYMIMAIRVKMDSIYGNVYRLKSLKKDSFLSELLPAQAKIIRRVTIGEEKSWFVVELLGKEIPVYGLIRGKDDYMISKGENQIVNFLCVDDPQWVLNATSLAKENFKVGAWAVVE